MIKVCYLDANDREIVIGKAKDVDEMWSIVIDYLEKKGIKSPYMRTMGRDDDSIMMDFGSYTDFFICYRKGLTAEIFKDVE